MSLDIYLYTDLCMHEWYEGGEGLFFFLYQRIFLWMCGLVKKNGSNTDKCIEKLSNVSMRLFLSIYTRKVVILAHTSVCVSQWLFGRQRWSMISILGSRCECHWDDADYGYYGTWIGICTHVCVFSLWWWWSLWQRVHENEHVCHFCVSLHVSGRACICMDLCNDAVTTSYVAMWVWKRGNVWVWVLHSWLLSSFVMTAFVSVDDKRLCKYLLTSPCYTNYVVVDGECMPSLCVYL